MRNTPFLLFTLSCILATSAWAVAPSLPVPAEAEARVGAPELVVSTDRLDWTYAVGEPVTFRLNVLFDGQPLPGAAVRYRVGPEKFEGEWMEATLDDGVLEIDGGTMEEPGFLRCEVTMKQDGRTYSGLATAAFDPTGIQPTQADPEDFDAFWQDNLRELASIPLKLEKTLLPERCTSDVNVYHVSYQTWGPGGPTRFYGILTEPVEPGSYPAVLLVPGAGVRAYRGDVGMASRGAIVLQVGIHGLPVNLDERVYEDLRHAALHGYATYNLEDPERYYYRRVYLGCVRGNDVLTGHPMWNGETLVVAGGSQGGQLSIVTSALDPRVTGTVSNYPAYCDVTGYLHNRAGGWPHMLSSEEHRSEAKIRTTSYYDVVNFARRLRAPGSYAWGYNDKVCPPTSMFAAYNVITAPKSLQLELSMGHRSSEAFNNRFQERIREMAALGERE